MEIEAWFETMPSHVVNDIAQEKRYIAFAIHDHKALSFKNQDYIIKDILSMSRKVKNARLEKEPQITPARPVGKGASKTRWANCDIRTKEHKTAIREMAANVNFVLDTIVELVDDGYELIIKRGDTGSTVRSMLFCNIDGHANKSGGLSAEAADAWLSLTCLVYKHSTVLDGTWFGSADEDEQDDFLR